MPHPTERIAVFIQKQNIDILLCRQLDSISRKSGTCGYQNGLNLAGRDFRNLAICSDLEEFAAPLEVGTIGVDDELEHSYSIFCGEAPT